MGGFIRRSPNDDSYIVLLWLTYISVLLFIPLLLLYLALIGYRWIVIA